MDLTTTTRVSSTTLVKWLLVLLKFYFTFGGERTEPDVYGVADPGGRPVAIALDTVCPVYLAPLA